MRRRSRRAGIDWALVSSRLEEARGAYERALEPGEERVREVWRERAAALAARSSTSERETGEPVLGFALGEESLAVPLRLLAEVLPAGPCALVPGAPPEVLGLLGRRGGILPVLDLAALVGLPSAGAPAEGYLLVLRDRELALRVDGLHEVRRLPSQGLRPAADSGPGRFLRGRASDGTGVLDLEAVLSHPLLQESEEGA